MTITLEQQIACVKREIGMRQRVYPRWVANGKMKQAEADKELAALDRSDPVILFARPGAVSKPDRAALKAAGVLVVEVDDPQTVKLTRAHAEVDGTDLLRIACQSIHEANSTNSVKDLFGRNLAAFLAGK